MREPVPEMRLPYRLSCAFGSEKNDTLPLTKDEALYQHKPDKCLAESDAIAKERPPVLAGDFHEGPISLFLIQVEAVEHPGAGFIPLGSCQLVSPEELLERLRINVEGSIETN